MKKETAGSLDIREADRNLEKLRMNPYSGRGIVIGLNEEGLGIQVYWVTGRSQNSQNRVLSQDGGRVYTEPADPSLVTDPTLIIYNAMREGGGSGGQLYAVSNGVQTDAFFPRIGASLKACQSILNEWHYEPDAPNFTPRISACSEVEHGRFDSRMSSIRKSVTSDASEREVWSVSSRRYVGHCLTTYSGNGTPLPSFRGEPYLVPLYGTINDIAWTFWDILNRDTRVSLVVKGIDLYSTRSEVRIINRFTKVT